LLFTFAVAFAVEVVGAFFGWDLIPLLDIEGGMWFYKIRTIRVPTSSLQNNHLTRKSLLFWRTSDNESQSKLDHRSQVIYKRLFVEFLLQHHDESIMMSWNHKQNDRQKIKKRTTERTSGDRRRTDHMILINVEENRNVLKDVQKT
jgi:hypothetical protein